MLKRRRALLAWGAAPIALLAALAVTLSWRTPGDPALRIARPAEQPVTVYLVDNGFHSNLVVAADRLRARGGPAAAALARLEPAPFTEIGWGDRRFYIETGASPRRALDGLRALFWPANR